MKKWSRKKSQKIENLEMGIIHNSINNLINISIISLFFRRFDVYISELNKKFYLLEVYYDQYEGDTIVNYEIFSDKDIDRLKGLFYKRNASFIKSLKDDIKRKNLTIRKTNEFLKNPSETLLSYKEIKARSEAK